MPTFSRNLATLMLSATLSACATTESSPASDASVTPVSTSQTAAAVSPLHELAPSDGQALTLEAIMADPDWLGRQPESGFWQPDSQSVGFLRKQLGSPLRDLWIKPLAEGEAASKTSLENMHLNSSQNGVFDLGRTHYAWSFEGNVFLRNMQSEAVRQLTADGAGASQLQFLDDGQLSFKRADAFYSVSLTSGLVTKRVGWSFVDAPKANKPLKDFIAKEQVDLIGYTAQQRRHRKERFEQAAELRKVNANVTQRDFYFDKSQRTDAAVLSPDGRYMVLVTRDSSATRKDTDIMPNYIMENGRVEAKAVRARVADAEPRGSQFYLLDVSGRTVTKLGMEALPGYNDDVLEGVKRENAEAIGETYTVNRLPRHINLITDWYWRQSPVQWHRKGRHVAMMVEAWDNKDRWLVTVDTQSGDLNTQHRLHDEAWINYKFNSFGWLNQDETLYYLSEESGYSHLYVKPLGGQAKALTRGEFEVDELTLTRDDGFIYYQANKKHPGIYEIYRVDLGSGQHRALTDLNGNTQYRLSPDEQKLLLTHSKLTRPNELYVQNIAAEQATQLTDTLSPAFKQMGFRAPQIVAVPSSHQGQPVFSRVYLPENYQAGKPRRAVIFNHGAGYLQNAHLGWSGYFREFMFHNLLAQQGYVVLDMDYRASAGYGRDWRTAIYRQMGTPEIQDLADGINWLVDNANVDRQRVGTYGGSYGGFMTFMALFTQPDLFQAGAALRPVTDWAHYNLPYTANILNTPKDDAIAFRRSSPIYFAEGLEKPLLINAPMVDDNVFFVDVVRLVQRLIELEKQDFETAIYPVEPHGFRQPSSWLDEYRRIYKLFEQNL